jgi:acyl-CoA synthetase (AMP-forming)/AMP-acid ligase II/acyl carrier protein
LMVGARVALISSADAADGSRLLELLDHSQATVMQATPATWRLLLATEWQRNNSLKILCGGEALPRDLADQLLERSNSVWNLYGPTETTIWSTVNKVEPGDGAVSIGRPISNTQIFILDSHLQPVPIGASGNLYIGGDGLARGYLNRPELTGEKFIPNPFSDEPGGRIYRTGDLARYLPDGSIEFFGRIDHQVKVRGFRIELGEIETMLNVHPGIREAVVIVREDNPGDKRLVAYTVPDQEPVPTTSDLRKFLGEKLPGYMVPSVFVTLDALPLTPNGKVDRRVLPAPDQNRPELEVTFAAPRTPVEEGVAKIWAELLGLERVGIHDNFFELGGHSLLAAQVISRLDSEFEVKLSLRSFFEVPTITELVTMIEKVGNSDSGLLDDRGENDNLEDALRKLESF